MKFRRLLYAVAILFGVLMLVLSLMIKRESVILKDAIVYKIEKLDALTDTVKQLIATVEAKKRKVDNLRAYVSKATEQQKGGYDRLPTSPPSRKLKELHIQTVPAERQASCRCEPRPYTKISPGRYVIADVNPIVYLPENTCHPKPSDIDMELNFSDSSTLGAHNIQLVLSNRAAVMTGACFKTVTGKIGFTVERYALHCDASVVGPSAQDKLPVRQILIDLKPQAPLRYQLKLVVNIDCNVITGVMELYLGGQMTNSARFKIRHTPLQL